MNKIFVIGFNKTATTTLHTILDKYVGNSTHDTLWWSYSNLIDRIWHPDKKFSNKEHSKKVIAKDYSLEYFSKYKCFTDGYEGWYGTNIRDQVFPDLKFLDENFPDSRFILNIRNLDKWLLSRLYNYYKKDVYPVSVINIENESEVISVLSNWVKINKYWHNYVTNYFKYRDDFITIDIDTNWINKLNGFLGINIKELPINNKTTYDNKKIKLKEIIKNFIKNNG